MDPINKFEKWYQQELLKSEAAIPSACCLSTLGEEGYPNARFLSLKEITDGKFVITGSLTSRKGIEIKNNPKVALTFWWDASKKQIRIQGDAKELENEVALQYFKERSLESRIVSTISKQGALISDFKTLKKKFEQELKASKNKTIDKPKNWGGFYINPIRIEFLEFENSRLHYRELYTKKSNIWHKEFIQP